MRLHPPVFCHSRPPIFRRNLRHSKADEKQNLSISHISDLYLCLHAPPKLVGCPSCWKRERNESYGFPRERLVCSLFSALPEEQKHAPCQVQEVNVRQLAVRPLRHWV